MTFMHQLFWPQLDVKLVHTDTFTDLAWGQRIDRAMTPVITSKGDNKNVCFRQRLFSESVSYVTDSTVERKNRLIARAIDEFRCDIKRTSSAKDELPRRPRPFLSTIRRVFAYLTMCMHNRRSQSIVACINRNTLESTDISVVWYKRARLRQLTNLG